MTGIWDMTKIHCDIICDRVTCLKWCEEQRLLPVRRVCREGHEMLIVNGKSCFGLFRCSKKHSDGKRVAYSRTRGTVFEGKKVSPEKVLVMIFCFVHDLTYHACILETSIDSGVTSKETVSEFYSFFRELITQHLLELSKCSALIGGTDRAVDILEVCLDKRKYNIGPFCKGTKIAVMIERGPMNFCIEICHANEWTTENLLQLIRKNIAKGSSIILNAGRNCSVLAQEGYIIQNDRLCSTYKDIIFLNSDTSVDSVQSRTYTTPEDTKVDKLLEFLYKFDVRKRNLDPFETFLDIIRHRFPT